MAEATWRRLPLGIPPLKVLLVSSGSGSRGGGEIYLVRLAEGLVAHGAIVNALVPDAERMDELADSLSATCTVTRFPFTATYQRKTRTVGAILDRASHARLAKLFRTMEPDIIHVNQQVAEDGLDLLLAAKASLLPFVSTIHIGHGATELGAHFGNVRDRLTRGTLRKIGANHIAVSAASRDQLAVRLSNVKLHMVHNGVGAPSKSDLSEARIKARSEWGVANDDIVVGVVGRIEPQKNPLALVDDVLPTPSIKNRIVLVWIGDGSMRASLETHATMSKHKPRLIIDGWRADAALRLAGFDVFLLPSRFEGLPLAILEAMHAGLPIVASRSDGTTEAIQDGVSGFLCNSDLERRQAINLLVKDDTLRKKIGTAARKAAVAQFSSNAMAQASADVYLSILSASKLNNEE